MTDKIGVYFPKPDEITLAVIRYGNLPLGQVETVAPVSKDDLAKLMAERHDFSEKKIRQLLGRMEEGTHTVVFDVNEMRRSGLYDKEIDFNTVVTNTWDGMLTHTYSPECPDGCTGQMEGCHYK